MLVKPSPKQKACTATCPGRPTSSASGARMGISKKAFAEPELTKKFRASTSRKIITAAP